MNWPYAIKWLVIGTTAVIVVPILGLALIVALFFGGFAAWLSIVH